MDRLEEKKPSYRREIPSLDDYEVMAKSLKVNNDSTFEKVDEVEEVRRDRMNKVMTISFWQSIKICDGYTDKLSKTFPKFWIGEITKLNKTKQKPKLNEFLKNVKSIGHGKETHGFGVTESELAPMTNYYDRLSCFMECDFLPQLFCASSNRNNMHKDARKYIFEQNGIDIVPRKRYAIEEDEDIFEESSDDESCDDDDDNESDNL